MTATTLSPDSALDALRGERATRPALDTTAAPRRRAELELGVAEILGEAVPDTPVIINASSLRRSPHAPDLHDSARGRVRGALVSLLLRLHSVGAEIGDPFDDAVIAWRAEGPAPELLGHFDALDPDERARLATDVTAHYVILTRALGEVPAGWTARTAQRASLRLGAGRVLMRDTVDLVVGSCADDVTTVALLDVTTAPLGEGSERALRYHALVETLRTSVVPLRCAVLSTATGEFLVRDVDADLLEHSVLDVLSTLHELWRAR